MTARLEDRTLAEIARWAQQHYADSQHLRDVRALLDAIDELETDLALANEEAGALRDQVEEEGGNVRIILGEEVSSHA